MRRMKMRPARNSLRRKTDTMKAQAITMHRSHPAHNLELLRDGPKRRASMREVLLHPGKDVIMLPG